MSAQILSGRLWISRVALLWGGIVIGSSFIATPAKFMAPDLSLPVALEVGRATFHTLMYGEVVLAIIGLTLVLLSRNLKNWFWLPVMIFALQWLWVMPLLDVQTVAEIQGHPVVGPPWHIAFGILGLAKVVVLLLIGLWKTKVNSET